MIHQGINIVLTCRSLPEEYLYSEPSKKNKCRAGSTPHAKRRNVKRKNKHK